MKDLDFRGNILSGTKYRVSPEGVSLMDETNNLAKQVVHKTTRTNCNRLKAIKFAVTSRMSFTIDHSASAFVLYAGYAGFVLGDGSNQY